MVRNAIVAALALALAQPFPAETQPTMRAQYKNAVLGMTLADWKDLPFPGAPKPSDTTVVICTDNQNWKKLSDPLPVSSVEQTLGVIECSYYTDHKSGGGFLMGSTVFTMRSVVPLGAEHTMFDVDYAFYQGRLFRIRGSSQLGGIDDMVDGLTAKYGKPVVVQSTVQNGLGTSLPKTDYTWEVGQDILLASAPSGRIDRSAVVFLDSQANKQLAAAKQRLDPAADKM
jgi:hypothetical protein